MSDIKGQLIKNSYNYVLQSDLITGIVYRIGGDVPTNPKFVSGLTVNANFTYSDGTEFPGFVLTCDAAGNAVWGPVSAATSGIYVTGGTFDYTTGSLELRNSNGSSVNITGLTDTYVTGGVVSGNSIVFSYNDTNTFEVSGITSFDTFTSYTASTEQILNSKTDNSTFNQFAQDTNIALNNRVEISTFTAYTATTQPLILNAVTGGTFSGSTLYLINNSGTTIPITGFTTSSTGDYLPLSGGTVTGPTIFQSGLTANTISATSINRVDYIVFNTGTTSAATVPGTVYFDNVEKALSYNTSINQGVTVNLGQQNYLRVYNNSGSPILKGKVVELLSTFGGLPSVVLAVNRNVNDRDVIGVAAETIPNNSEGIVLTYGIISNITVTGGSIGSLVYASDINPGEFKNATEFLDFPLTARTNAVGYVIQTGTTTGKLFVNPVNENNTLSLTELQRNVLEGNVISTGVFAFSGITLASTSTFNVGAAEAWIVDNTTNPLYPSVIYVQYPGQTNIPSLYYNTATETYLLLTSAGTITQQTTFPTPQQRRQNVYLGKMGHGNRTSLINAFNEPDFDVSPNSQLRDMFSPIKLINENVYPSPNTGLTFNTSSGTLWGLGIGFVSNQLNPSSLTITANTPTTFQYRTQTGGTATNITTIDPGNYDLNGVITSIGSPSKQATNQRIYLLQNGQFRLQYGQTKYVDLTTAIAAVTTEVFTTFSNFRDNAILIAILSIRSDATLLSDITQAKITFASKFGESVGGTGGISTTTLQQAYDNSATPEITINSTLDGLSIKNGTGNADNVTRLLEGLNAAGNATSFIRADGDISGTTLQTNGFTANTGGITASTVNIRTIGSGTSITNLGIDSSGNIVIGSNTGTSSTFTGGTVSGPTYFTAGLTANTISATTYYNLPIDVYSTGGTYNGGNLYITNNTGGTFTVTGLTATGFSANYYGSFSNTTDILLSGANTPTVWTYNNTEISNGIVVENNSQIKVNNTGVYEFGYSPQIEKTQGSDANVTIWAAINGTPVTRSSSTLRLVSNSVLSLPFVSFIFEMNANDYVEFFFSSDNEFVQLTSLSGLTTPTRPDSPSLIIVAKQVGLSTTAGSSGDTFVTGFSLNNNVITLSQNRVDQYSAFTISLSAYTGNTSVSGNYLPLSGGTVTGSTNFTAGLTANTVSATTLTIGGSSTFKGGITGTTLSGTTSRMVEASSTGEITANSTIITAYITSGGTSANLLENSSNWDINGVYTGATITGTYQGQKHYNGNYLFEAVADNLFIRLIRG